jgi:hypothetical protein
MTAYKVIPFVTLESIVTPDGQLVLDGLPFQPGEVVEIIIRGQPTPSAIEQNPYPLQGSQPYRYDDPFEPAVPIEDWEVLK